MSIPQKPPFFCFNLIVKESVLVGHSTAQNHNSSVSPV